MTKIEAIARRRSRKEPMEVLHEGRIDVDLGLEGDYKGRARLRQISVLRAEDWQAVCNDANCSLPWTARRANVLVSGLEPFNADLIGRHMTLGDATLEIVCETEPCELMEKAVTGLSTAMETGWRGGLCGKVIKAGTIKVNDAVGLV